ncbi:unnamed protein product [Ixodes pacificus]
MFLIVGRESALDLLYCNIHFIIGSKRTPDPPARSDDSPFPPQRGDPVPSCFPSPEVLLFILQCIFFMSVDKLQCSVVPTICMLYVCNPRDAKLSSFCNGSCVY